MLLLFCPHSALINYCDPTLMTNFKSLNPSNSRENCTHAMQMAKDKFEVPMIVSPEDMCHPQIDELSGMTYLSYFLRTEGPGWYSTLNWVRKKVPELNVHNFQVKSCFSYSLASRSPSKDLWKLNVLIFCRGFQVEVGREVMISCPSKN